MTMKNQDKNISAENKRIVTSIIENAKGFTVNYENLYNGWTSDDSESPASNSQIFDLSNYKLHLIVLTDGIYTGEEKIEALEDINNQSNSRDIYSLNRMLSDDIEDDLVTFEDVDKFRKANVFLASANSNSEEGIYREYLWIEQNNAFEIIGSTSLSLENYTGTFGDLQRLINNANSGDTITLAKDYKNNGEETGIVINKDLTIVGNGYTLNADKKSSILSFINTPEQIDPERPEQINDINININGINFINGKDDEYGGGAINIGDHIKTNISDCSFSNNNSSSKGGAIYCVSSSSTIANCDFNNNISSENGGAICFRFSQYATIINCNFSDNKSSEKAGAIYSGNLDIIENCSFNNNKVEDGSGGAIYCVASPDKIANCIFKNNEATNGNDIYSSPSITVYNCDTISANLYNVTNKLYLTDHQTAIATTSANGLMSSTDKTKLDGMDTLEWTITYDDDSTSTITLIVQREEEE